MLELAKLVLKLADQNKEPEMIKLKESDRTKEREIFKRIPDISKAKRLLGYEPKISIEEGIERILKYYEKHDN